MGLSTVSQNLNLLENEGLIEKNGYFDSTGGRKANAIQIVSDFRISIGVGILKNMFHITAIDLYGNTVYTDTIPLTYSNTAAYYQQITDKVKDFIDKNQYPENKILGVSIATQGITSPDNTTVIYGNIMNNTGMRLKDFSRHLPYPCHLEHDSKSAAFLELWNHPELDSAVVLFIESKSWRCHYHQSPDSPGTFYAQRNNRAYMRQPRRTALLLRKPGLSGNLLLCQLLGTGQRHDYKGIFSSFKRKKIPPRLYKSGRII